MLVRITVTSPPRLGLVTEASSGVTGLMTKCATLPWPYFPRKLWVLGARSGPEPSSSGGDWQRLRLDPRAVSARFSFMKGPHARGRLAEVRGANSPTGPL